MQPLAQLEQALRDGEIINRAGQLVFHGGGAEVMLHLHREQEPLGFGAFLVRHAHAVKHFQFVDRDRVHKSGLDGFQ